VNLAEALDMEVLKEVAEELPLKLEELTTTLEDLNAGLAKSLSQQEKKEKEKEDEKKRTTETQAVMKEVIRL
jgi:hypothetical protein